MVISTRFERVTLRLGICSEVLCYKGFRCQSEAAIFLPVDTP